MAIKKEPGETIAVTIEVVVMNAYGIGLAADSTLHYPPVGGQPERVFSHADKIFDLSYDGAPAALMINGMLQIQGRPLSTVLQLFSARSFRALEDLQKGMLVHLEESLSVDGLVGTSEQAFLGMRILDCVQWLQDARPGTTAKRPRGGRGFNPTLIDAVEHHEVPALAHKASDAEFWASIIDGYSKDRRAELSAALHRFLHSTKITGLVLVGYERGELFPQIAEINIHRHGDRLLLRLTQPQKIESMKESLLLSFSMDDEVRAFRDGIHPAIVPADFSDYMVTSETALNQTLLSFLDALKDAPMPDESSRTHVIRIASLAATEHMETWRKAQQDFAEELLRGLALFPIRMLPWVARVQVEHTILRATTRPEIPKVGSPVSVAVVSRESGFQMVNEEARFVIPQPRQSDHLAVF